MENPIIFTLNGAYFRNADTRHFVRNISEPIVCALIREPKNKYDRNAIKVMHGERHIGYVPRDLTYTIRGDNVPCKVTWNPSDEYKAFVIVD
jgi:hypothetical protein